MMVFVLYMDHEPRVYHAPCMSYATPTTRGARGIPSSSKHNGHSIDMSFVVCCGARPWNPRSATATQHRTLLRASCPRCHECYASSFTPLWRRVECTQTLGGTEGYLLLPGVHLRTQISEYCCVAQVHHDDVPLGYTHWVGDWNMHTILFNTYGITLCLALCF